MSSLLNKLISEGCHPYIRSELEALRSVPALNDDGEPVTILGYGNVQGYLYTTSAGVFISETGPHLTVTKGITVVKSEVELLRLFILCGAERAGGGYKIQNYSDFPDIMFTYCEKEPSEQYSWEDEWLTTAEVTITL